MIEHTQAASTPPPLPKKSHSRALLVSIIVTILLIPPTALLIWYTSVRMSNASAIRELENEVRQRGEPLTLAELQAKYPPIPDEENAAVPLIELWKTQDPTLWEAFFNGERPLPESVPEKYDPALPYLGSDATRIPRSGPLDSNSLSAARSYLSAKASHMEQFRAAMRRPRFRFPARIEEGPDTLLPHLAKIKAEALNFQIATLVASERGDKVAAIAAVKETAQTGQILVNEPLLISQLVRIACVNLALDGIEQLLSRQSLTFDELEGLRLFLEEINLHGAARSSLVNERPFSLCVFKPEMAARVAVDNSSNDDADNPEQTARSIRTGFGFMQSVGFLEPDRRLMLATFKEAINLAEKETPESLRKIETLFDEIHTRARKFPPKIFSATMLPALQRVPIRFASFESRRRAGLTAIAVERYRLEHQSRIPEKLDGLVPAYLLAIPADPFDGQPLRFLKLERGFVVYSIGSDREDDGGRERRHTGVQNIDITFTVER